MEVNISKVISQLWRIELGTSMTLVAEVALRRLSLDQKERLRDFLLANAAKTLQEIADDLARASFGGGGAPVMPPGIAVALRSIHGDMGKLKKIISDVPHPVHGPFAKSVYEDEEFVKHYTKARYLSRVAETKSILASLGNVHVVAPGDGAGVAYEAAKLLQAQGHRITVQSYDDSEKMIKVADRLGNIVEKQTIMETLRTHKGAIFFLSHVTDYMSERDIEAYSKEKTIIYGRPMTFPGCVNFKPYDRDWGYQLCSSHVALAGVSVSMALRIQPGVDYTVFSHILTQQTHMIDIDEGLEMYVEEARNLNLRITQEADVVVTVDIEDKRKIVAVPGVGVIGKAWGAHLLTVCPPELVIFSEFHNFPFYFAPAYIGHKFFFSGETARVDDGVRNVILQAREIGKLKFYIVPPKMRTGCVQLDGCVCYNSPPHCHVLKITAQKKVIWGNLVAKVKRSDGGKITRAGLYRGYVSSCGTDSVDVDTTFFAMERSNNVEYDIGSGYYRSTDD